MDQKRAPRTFTLRIAPQQRYAIEEVTRRRHLTQRRFIEIAVERYLQAPAVPSVQKSGGEQIAWACSVSGELYERVQIGAAARRCSVAAMFYSALVAELSVATS